MEAPAPSWLAKCSTTLVAVAPLLAAAGAHLSSPGFEHVASLRSIASESSVERRIPVDVQAEYVFIPAEHQIYDDVWSACSVTPNEHQIYDDVMKRPTAMTTEPLTLDV